MNQYENEWRRTNPDLEVYIPQEASGFDAVNQHFLVTRSPLGSWLAFWTSAADEGEMNQSVLISRSSDRGMHWSEPAVIDGPRMKNRDFKAPVQIDGVWTASASVVGSVQPEPHALPHTCALRRVRPTLAQALPQLQTSRGAWLRTSAYSAFQSS